MPCRSLSNTTPQVCSPCRRLTFCYSSNLRKAAKLSAERSGPRSYAQSYCKLLPVACWSAVRQWQGCSFRRLREMWLN